MNNIKIDYFKITNTDPKNNLFELRRQIYDKLIKKIHQQIDHLYDLLVSEKKAEDISTRSIKSQINKESLTYLYHGLEIPHMNKTCIILDNIEYIPIFQLVDKCIHLQKDGKYLVVKNNIRNTFLKLDGRECNVFYRNGVIPLLPYLLYIYDTVEEMLIDLGYTILHPNEVDLESDDYFIVPEYYKNTFLLVKKDFELNGWKNYFLSPFVKDKFEYHQNICNTIIDQINNNIIPDIIDESGEFNKMEDIKNESILDEKLEENKRKRANVTEKNAREYILVPHNKNQDLLDKIFSVINVYHISTRTVKRSITKMYLETSLFKFMSKDITMNDVSLFDMIIDHVKNDILIPDKYDISDVSQKNLRFLEWYAMKLSSVRSYPDQNLIMEVAKTEPKKIYANCVNPISELSIMSRVNLFGAGALPKDACQSNVRNLHKSHFGVLDPSNSPAGATIGISLSIVPEVCSEDMYKEVGRLKDNNIFSLLFNIDKGV